MAISDTTWLGLIQKSPKAFLESLESKSAEHQVYGSLQVFVWEEALHMMGISYNYDNRKIYRIGCG